MFGLLWMIFGCGFGVFMLFGTMCVAWLLVVYLGAACVLFVMILVCDLFCWLCYVVVTCGWSSLRCALLCVFCWLLGVCAYCWVLLFGCLVTIVVCFRVLVLMHDLLWFWLVVLPLFSLCLFWAASCCVWL